MFSRVGRFGMCRMWPFARKLSPWIVSGGFPCAISLMVKSNSCRATNSIAFELESARSGSTATWAPTRPIRREGFSAFRASATRTSCANDGVLGWSIDEARAGDHGGGLREPRRVPERADLAPRLVARAGAAVEALIGGRVQEERAEIGPIGCSHAGSSDFGVIGAGPAG